MEGDFGASLPVPLGAGLDSSVFSDFMGPGSFIVKLNSENSVQWDAPFMDASVTIPGLSGYVSLEYTVIPEPSSAAMLVLGLGALSATRRTRRSRE